jgi:hypothetical protein
MESTAATPEIRLAQSADLPQIASFLIPLGGEFFAERFPGKTSLDFYRWKYFSNPQGAAIIGIATANDTVVSVVAATPKRIWISGKTILAYELGDFLTDENYRKMGLFSQLIGMLCRETAASGAALVYVRPNDVSFPILVSKLSFHEAQKIDARNFVLPSWALSRKTKIPGTLFRASGMDWWFQKKFAGHSPTESTQVQKIDRFDESIDHLWQKAAAGYDFALVRDSSYLNWRYADCPTPYKIWLGRRENRAVGFLVTVDRSALNAAIVDIFTENGDTETARVLLSAAGKNLLDNGMKLITTWTLQGPINSAADQLLREALPRRRKNHLHLAIRELNPQNVTLLQSSQKWHFTLGDSDGA